MQHALNDSTQLQFPAGFLWGTATSSHQVEGNNTNNQWWRFEQQPGKIWNGDRSGLACDWWRNAESDFDLMQELGLSTPPSTATGRCSTGYGGAAWRRW